MPARRPEHRPVSLSGSHWRSDGEPKVRYDTRHAAVEAAELRGAEAGVALGTYRCDFCGGWHMGRRSEPAGPERPGRRSRSGSGSKRRRR